MRGQTIIAGIVILIFCAALAAADYLLVESPRIKAAQEFTAPAEQVPVQVVSSSQSSITSSAFAVTSSAPSSLPSMSSSSLMNQSTTSSVTGVVKKGVSTKKASGINVESVLAGLQLVMQKTNEASFLLLTAQDKSKVQTSVLLRNNDRAFLFAWMESDDVKIVFASLKQALQEQFSGKVTDLIDETKTPNNGPPVDYLAFTDPALSAEHIVFLRVRNRLYEIHIAKNGTELLEQLVKELGR